MKYLKITIFLFGVLTSTILLAQQNKGTLSGSLESTTQYYQDDSQIIVLLPQDRFASNNYLSLNYD